MIYVKFFISARVFVFLFLNILNSHGMDPIESSDTDYEVIIETNREERTQFDEQLAPLLKNTINTNARNIMRKVYRGTSQQDWPELLKLSMAFFKQYIPFDYINGLGRALFLNTLSRTPLADQKNLIKIMSFYFDRIDALKSDPLIYDRKFLSILKIMKFLKNYSIEKRETFYALSTPLLHISKDPNMHLKVLKILKKIPRANRENYVCANYSFYLLLQNMKDEQMKREVLNLFIETPPDIMKELTRDAGCYFLSFFQSLRMTSSDSVFKAIRSIPPQNRFYFLGTVLPSLQIIPSWKIRTAILNSHGLFPPEVIAELVNKTTVPLFLGILDNPEEILKVLSVYNDNRHESLIRNTMPFIQNIPSGKERALTLEIFKDISPEDHMVFTKIVSPFMDKYEPNGCINQKRPSSKILKKLENENHLFIQEDIEEYVEYYVRVEILYLFKGIFDRSPDVLIEIINLVTPSLEKISQAEFEVGEYTFLYKMLMELRRKSLNRAEREVIFKDFFEEIMEELSEHRGECQKRVKKNLR